jgi:hypothetical protein
VTDILLPNAPQALGPLAESGRIPKRRVWGMLWLRSGLSFGLLLSLAAVLAVKGSPSALRDSSAWWLWFVTVTNVVCIALMVKFGRLEGLRLRDLYFAQRSTWRAIWPGPCVGPDGHSRHRPAPRQPAGAGAVG